ncbi:unnamed protein product [Mytilus coruscus]|uniref:Uncharacterized protein n=1 Tax=Mytilus coruscus TaxID=42192 RepID=A0A6J8C2B3_MYTCO|nr:unnamed protein product [Mytilus coruscus]
MGTSCTKFERRRRENIRRRHFSRLRDYLSAKLQRLRGNRVVKITLQQSPIPSASNVSNRTYILSTKDEVTSENISPNDVIMELKRSASICSAFQNDEQELELIGLENKDEIGAAPTIADEAVLPTAKGGRSTTPIFESNINKKARPKAAKGVRTSMLIADGVVQDITIPGEVVSSDANMPLTSKTLLTVPAIKSVQQMYLDNWMYRHMDD